MSDRPVDFKSRTGDLSEGGLSFLLQEEVPEGTELDLTIPLEGHRFRMVGNVAYCRREASEDFFRIGIAFQNPDMAFRAKLAEEILRIEEFRKDLSKRLGKELTQEEAARRWIQKYAERFSAIYQ